MKRRMHAALLGVLALILGGGALVLTSAGTAGADDSGTVTVTPGTGSVADNPPLTQVTLPNGCPSGYQDAITVNVGIPDTGDSSIVYNLTDGAPYTASPLTVAIPATPGPSTYINSIADAFGNYGVPVTDGTYPLKVVCMSTDSTHTDTPTFTALIDITGDTWTVEQAAAPTSTATTLAADPADHVVVDHSPTLTATVSPSGAQGTVTFYNGPQIVGTAPATGGTATFTPTAIGGTSVLTYKAVFTPTDPTAFASSESSVITYHVLNEPAVTVLDDTGNTLQDTPTLKAGQKLDVTGTGFLTAPDGQQGEAVHVTVDDASAHTDATADATGTVSDVAVTLASGIADGDHTLTLKGATTGVTVSFPFKVGADNSGDTGGDTSGATAGDTSGSTAGDTGGSTAGDTSGSTAGDTGGSTAGDTSGTSGTSGDLSGGTSGMSGDTGGGTSGGGNGPLAATGAAGITTISLLALMLLCGGGYTVHRVRRDGRLLTFGPTPRD